MNHRNRLTASLWIALSLVILQSIEAQNETITFEHFNHENGLSAPVTKIAQDSLGFLWLATTDGLNRFDGKNFVVYRNIAGDTTSLPNNIINDLCVDAQGRVWIATNGGLCYYHFSDNAFHSIKYNDTLESIDRHRVHAVINAGDHKIWFATKTLIHLLREDHSVQTFALPGSENIAIKYLYQDAQDRLWIGTNGVLAVLDVTNNRVFQSRVSSAFTVERKLSTTIHPIIPYDGDTLLIGSWYGGVHKAFLSGDSLYCISIPDLAEASLRKHIVRGMCHKQAGTYWVGTYGNGLSVLDAATSTFIDHFHADPADPQSLSSDYIFDVFKDDSGIVWVGTGAGLDKFDPLTQQFKSISIPTGSNEFSVYFLPGSIEEDMHDPEWLWLTVSGVGVIHYHTTIGQFKLYQHDPNRPGALPDNAVYVIFQDHTGKIWIGMGSGLCVFDAKQERFTEIHLPATMPQPGVHKILQDAEDTYWFATNSYGIFSYNEGLQKVTSYMYDKTKPNSLPDNRVFCMIRDQKGYIWVGTQNRGLCRLDPRTGQFLFFEHDKSDLNTIPDNGIYDLYEDKKSQLWIATENGLSVMDLTSFSIKHYTTLNGLCNNDIFSITPDDRGFLWLSTNNGLSRFDPENASFKNYYIHDGLPTNIISGASYFASDGTLYCGSTGMLTFCQPGKMQMNKHIPPVVITDFKIFDKQATIIRDGEQLQPIHLSYRDNMVTFDFAALNFTNAPFNQYAYQLEGFDDQWIYCGYKQSATFTNLDGGTYTFRVKAANNDGIWNEVGTQVELIVHPPYWETWWFYLLCFLSITGLLFALYRFRINQLMRLQQIRGRISRDLHDDIGSTLSSINMISSMAAKTTPEQNKAADLFQTISTASSQAMELMSDIVWSINPKNDRMEMIIVRMRQYASEILEAAQMQFAIEMDEACQQLSLSVEQRKDFYLIFKEAINNVAKYSRARNVFIHLAVRDGRLRLNVKDDGIGFDETRSYSGNGLRNMKVRAAQLHGELSIRSQHMHGTQIILSLPVSP